MNKLLEDLFPDMTVSQIGGTILGRPLDKDYSILGSTLGSPHFWECTILFMRKTCTTWLILTTVS